MKATTTRMRSLVLGCGLLLLATAATPPVAGAALSCDRVPDLLRTFLQKHISFHYLNDELRRRTADSYIKRLDPSKTLLLADEVAQLRKSLMGVFHEVRSGDCTQLLSINEDMVKRYVELENYVRSVVGSDDYQLDPSVELIIDAEKRGHPRTAEYRDELRTKMIHFQISNYLSSGVELEEAKQKLIHRYELMTRRAREATHEDIYAGFLDAFATALDPHSNYLPADAREDFQIGMDLSLEGIGVALSSRDGYSVVEKVIPGGAADKLNVLAPNDKIIAVAQEDGEYVDIIDMNLRDVVRLIRGKRGTKVRLTVLRQGDPPERFEVTIVRDMIKLEDQAAKLRFENVEVADGRTLKLAILELPSFYGGKSPSARQSSRDIRNLLEQVKAEQADGLLLDLSRNGGGLLEDSIEIAGFFIGDGGIVAVKDTLSNIQVLRDPDDSILFNGPMVVLTSRLSASASEIVAGAMKDYKRAIVVGDDHTFGKGTVQSMVPLPTDLGALKVTTALFFRPGGASTQNSGVAADIVFPSLFSTEEFGESYQDYSLPQQKISPFLETESSPDAQQSEGSSWAHIDTELISQLAARSAERVRTSQDFEEIRRRLKEAKERNGVLKLEEILKQIENEGDEDGGKQEEPEQSSNADPSGRPGHAHRVEAGNTLWGLAQTYFGTPWEWPRIAQANPGIDPNRIEPGDEIWIPGEPEAVPEAPRQHPASEDRLADNENRPQADQESEALETTPQQREALSILADFVSLTS